MEPISTLDAFLANAMDLLASQSHAELNHPLTIEMAMYWAGWLICALDMPLMYRDALVARIMESNANLPAC